MLGLFEHATSHHVGFRGLAHLYYDCQVRLVRARFLVGCAQAIAGIAANALKQAIARRARRWNHRNQGLVNEARKNLERLVGIMAKRGGHVDGRLYGPSLYKDAAPA